MRKTCEKWGVAKTKKNIHHKKTINKNMKSIEMKGQSRATECANDWLASVERGLEIGAQIRPAMVYGPSGTGKSFLTGQIMDSLEDAGWETIRVKAFGEIGRGMEDCLPIHSAMTSGDERLAILVDEFQGIKGDGISKAVKTAWLSLLLSLGEKMPIRSRFPLFIGKDHFVDWNRVALVIATNTPDRLEDSASIRNGERPFRRRFTKVELSNYDDSVIGEVIGDFLASRGLRAAECSRGTIARFHRGNLEALDDIVKQYLSKYPDQPTVSQDRLLACAKLTEWLPRGINRKEGRLLLALLTAQGQKIRRSFAAATIGCSTGEVTGALAHLMRQKKSDGSPAPFVDVSGSCVVLTKAGAQYIETVIKAGFTL
jgi:hypothetical protein